MCFISWITVNFVIEGQEEEPSIWSRRTAIVGCNCRVLAGHVNWSDRVGPGCGVDEKNSKFCEIRFG